MCTCNNCKENFVTGFHCQECDNFDLCGTCMLELGHVHEMNLFGPDKIVYLSTDMHLCVQNFNHFEQCLDASCRLPSCEKMKQNFEHSKLCKKRYYEVCDICELLKRLCHFHAARCDDDHCKASYCLKLREEWKPKEKQQPQLMNSRLQQTSAGVTEASASAPRPPHASSSLHSSQQSTPSTSAAARAQPSPTGVEAVEEVGDCWPVMLKHVECLHFFCVV